MSSRDGVLRVGVVGAGAIAPPYYMALQAWPQLDLVSCTSRGMDSASAAAAKYGIAAVSIEAMLADPAIDVVVNLTPIQAHYSIGMSALQSGKHLYSEKLLAQTVAEGQALLHLAQEPAQSRTAIAM